MVVDSREQGSTRVKDCNSALSQYILLECISRGRATREFLEGPQRVQVSWKNSRRRSPLRCACEVSTLKKRKFWVRVYEEKHHDGHHRLPRTSARFSNTSQSRYTHSPPRSTNILPRDTLSSTTSNIVTGSDLPKTNYAACVAERHPGQGRLRFNLAALLSPRFLEISVRRFGRVRTRDSVEQHVAWVPALDHTLLQDYPWRRGTRHVSRFRTDYIWYCEERH